jgi:CRISPR-associated endonuclease Cas2
MKTFLIAYDIFDDKRLRKVKKIVSNFCSDGQKSAREAYLNHSLTKELLHQLEEIIEDEDKVNIIQIKKRPILLGKASFLEFEYEGMVIL